VQVAGLVEARLERFDNLIVAGLNEGKFPARGQRPLFLDSRVRGELGLPTRRDSLARDAELFLRLLHNAPRVILTWSRTDGDQDLLPSPLLERLLLSRDVDETLPVVSQVPLWRAGGPPGGDPESAQKEFRAESLDVPVQLEGPGVRRLSWTALQRWRECPYRFLLERPLPAAPHRRGAGGVQQARFRQPHPQFHEAIPGTRRARLASPRGGR
jgi:ATP-dependent helicase/nuclease subunit B